MVKSSPEFTLKISGVRGVCPAGEKFAEESLATGKTPVLFCEGPCIWGDIARLAADMVTKDEPDYARCCYAETFLVPHSSMTRWVKEAEEVVVMDGCFLKRNGRMLKNFIDEEKIVQIDTLPLHKKYSDIFLMNDVPEVERKEVAREVADKILVTLKEQRKERAAA